MFPTGKFRKIDTSFWMDFINEKELLAAVPLTLDSLCKLDVEFHGKCGHTLGRKQHISIISRIEMFYTAFHLGTQTVAHNIPGLQGLNR